MFNSNVFAAALIAAALSGAAAEAQAAAGFSLQSVARTTPEGVAVAGRVCRTSPVKAAPGSAVQIEIVGEGGRVVSRTSADLSRELTMRREGCAFFHKAMAALPGDATLRVSYGASAVTLTAPAEG